MVQQLKITYNKTIILKVFHTEYVSKRLNEFILNVTYNSFQNRTNYTKYLYFSGFEIIKTA